MKEKLKLFLEAELKKSYNLDIPIHITEARDTTFGDYTINLLFTLSKLVSSFDREAFLQQLLVAKPEFITKIEFTKNGFINFFLDTKVFLEQSLFLIEQRAEDFGKSSAGAGRRVLLEFVSANPTGPLHVGHGRGAVLGDVLGNVLQANGYKVEREYYVNDAGRQMDILALSVWSRYLGNLGKKFTLEGIYQGEYIAHIGSELYKEFADRFAKPIEIEANDDIDKALDQMILKCKEALGDDYQLIKSHTLDRLLTIIKGDLSSLNVKFDSWFSEKSLFDTGKVQSFVSDIIQKDLAYEKDGAIWFRSSQFGDEKDRVMKRTNGEYTYFASDIAYHVNKYERGYDMLINIWGADHHGYISRVKNALQALGKDSDKLKIKLLQFVSLVGSEGNLISMSTRKATFVDVRELVDKVGLEATRFFYVMKDSDQSMEFDLAKAIAKNNENPVWYIQYALARINAILRKVDSESHSQTSSEFTDIDKEIVLKLMAFEAVVRKVADVLQPHLVANYLLDLARLFHHYYGQTRVITEGSLDTKALRIYQSTKIVIENSLHLLGINPISIDEEM